MKAFIQIITFIGMISSVYAGGDLKIHQVIEKEGHYYFDISHISLPDKQIVLFYGGFHDFSYDKSEEIMKLIEEDKDIHLYIGRGTGGDVSQHKKFVGKLKKACSKRFSRKKTCRLVTYLDGQCSSMCTTLFLEGDIRYARDHWFANLGFHRTVTKAFGKTIPIQSVNNMARYFKRFTGVNESFIDRNKRVIFNQPNNALYKLSGEKLLEAGFVQYMTSKLDGSKESFLQNFFAIEL